MSRRNWAFDIALAAVVGVLGQLEATANWHRIMSEYLLDGPPASPLGREDAEFWESRPARRAA